MWSLNCSGHACADQLCALWPHPGPGRVTKGVTRLSSEPSIPTHPPTLLPSQQAPAGGRSGVIPPPTRGAPQPEQLKEAEASVMRLEKELGTSHPEVCPAPTAAL